MKTLRETTEDFLNNADFLGDVIYAPAKTQLLLLADEIMLQPASGALHSQYGLLYRFLMKEKDQEQAPEQDIITRILSGESV